MDFFTDKELIEKINRLRKEKHAVILAHNYQLGEIQDIADFCGDSLELSIKAKNVNADMIVFCGVTFMAETAYILSPSKTVLLPNLGAGCLMADMLTGEDVRKMKAAHPGSVVLCYVNSTAEVKAESDICVTSANALEIAKSVAADKEILFVPDSNLGNYVMHKTGRKMTMFPGYCPTHMRLKKEDILARKKEFPDAKVIIHPESRLEVIELADEVLSTGGMCGYVKESDSRQFIIATESGILHRLRRENPGKLLVPVSEEAVCYTMKMIRLIDLYNSLKKEEYKITVPEDVRIKALRPIEKMLELSAHLNIR
ncbi:MAG: quinolinate synthase [Lentisphaerae bacterium GWF2_45_14]|nr:MAG: quinolinate synthase [Lentisphaerae bacterium GWF2_45_14]